MKCSRCGHKMRSVLRFEKDQSREFMRCPSCWTENELVKSITNVSKVARNSEARECAEEDHV